MALTVLFAVICGRVADAAPTIGAAMWYHVCFDNVIVRSLLS